MAETTNGGARVETVLRAEIVEWRVASHADPAQFALHFDLVLEDGRRAFLDVGSQDLRDALQRADPSKTGPARQL